MPRIVPVARFLPDARHAMHVGLAEDPPARAPSAGRRADAVVRAQAARPAAIDRPRRAMMRIGDSFALQLHGRPGA